MVPLIATRRLTAARVVLAARAARIASQTFFRADVAVDRCCWSLPRRHRLPIPTTRAGPVFVAGFSLDALAPIFDARDPNVVVRVASDKVARGSTPFDCV
jgi:hypothetical protein